MIDWEPLKVEHKGVKIAVYPTEGSDPSRIVYDVMVGSQEPLGYWGTCFRLDEVKPTIKSIIEMIDKGERLFDW